MFAVKRYAGDARPCHRRHLRRRRTLKVSHHLDARDVRGFYLVTFSNHSTKGASTLCYVGTKS